ncbi:chromosome segregation protein SMC [Treponema phagedenis]|uniref:Chromosome partition protein Smc n=1 Tax=Treponema phagedenis TaxID=162 RepID=A0A0B7GWL8_TREPH|nr:AAA family ATPase [Treponema phagedenis]NVP24881.1 AAA family ATPase [Treponema phagedenis]QEJ94339.1 AAA family ATPase [Treponema phagedenis]QEJ98984.1 AAA family ATPase [Treponema phagedenis]QEK00301.1 AAA family ATPase [Treponema phagedenis]QEK04492.1 AAA family ATPase [Treponema phagedenis]
MFLKSLEIFGFKSFADRTRIEFSEGITALLGPNGCGKSNVVDAIKWVLGEQSPKTLRADKMEDVIFNGTETRKPLNVAEVTFTISNETGILDLDIPEIAIKRRLFRSGESEYFINNNPAKLKEIRELFWDTGVGKVAYSVMEQGKIDQILSSKPEDRRYLFEEAAGITKFKIRRMEAERKLEKTQENMRQIDGILQEVSKSYETLKKQAEQTKRYRKLKDEIFEDELDINLLRLKGFVDNHAQRSENIKATKEKRDSLQAEIDSIHALLSENMDEINAMETKLDGFHKEIYGLAIEQKAKQNEAQLHAQRQSELKTKIGQLEVRKSSIEERIEELRENIDEQEATILKLKAAAAAIEKNIASFEENIRLASGKITANDTAAAKLEEEITDLNGKRAKLEEALREITEDIVTELDKKLSAAGYSAKAKTETEERLFETIGKLRIFATGRKNIFSDFATVQQMVEKEREKFAISAVETFSEILSLIEQLEKDLQEYKKSSANFIDEFLAPEGIITKKRNIDSQIAENRQTIEEKRSQILNLNAENSQLAIKIAEYRKTLEELRINRAQMRAESEAAERQATLIRRELTNQEGLLKDIENEIFSEQKRFDEVKEQLLEIEGEIASIERKGRQLTESLENLEKEIGSKNSLLSSKEKKLQSFTAEMSKVQTSLEKYHLESAQLETEIKNVKDNFRELYSRELMEYEERMYKIKKSSSDLRTELAERKSHVKALGNVNLMAVEEFEEVKERYDFLNTQIADLEKASADLQRITDEIKAESTELFLATYNKIKKNFHNMFRRLFGGGRAEIRLTDPKMVLESGIDIFAQPPGKKLENIGLLSGGEKSMTAVALLFATYMVKPSPFCLLDEIDAALDEQNVIRFVTALREFANISQYIIITHNKKTVLGAKTMLGVTMEESGVSKIISIKLDHESELLRKAAIDSADDFVEEDVAPEEGVVIPPHPPKRIKTVQSQSKTLNSETQTENNADTVINTDSDTDAGAEKESERSEEASSLVSENDFSENEPDEDTENR